MCIISNIGDQWGRDFPERYPWTTTPAVDTGSATTTTQIVIEGASKEDVEKLRQEVLELKKLLLAAKQFDEATGQKDCEMEEKIALIRAVAEAVGVDVDEVFGPKEDGQ